MTPGSYCLKELAGISTASHGDEGTFLGALSRFLVAALMTLSIGCAVIGTRAAGRLWFEDCAGVRGEAETKSVHIKTRSKFTAISGASAIR